MFRATRACGVLAALGLTMATSLSVALPAEAGEPAPVEVSIDGHRMITMPASIQPGVNTFHITAEKDSPFQLLLPAEGYTIDEAVNDIEQGLNQGHVKAFKRFERNITLYGGVTATPDRAGRLTVSLPAGSYWALDTNTHKASKVFSFEVTGADTGSTMPDVKTLRAIDSTTFAKRPRAIPRSGMIGFLNSADQNHFLALAKLKKGKDVGDFRRWIKALLEGQGGRPPVRFGVGFDTGVASPGVEYQASYRVPRGRYILTCFWPDADMDLMPHAFMGMFRGVRVS